MNQFGRVAAYLSSPHWCVYSAQCRVRHINTNPEDITFTLVVHTKK